MHVVSVNVGLPREVERRGETVRTGIFETPLTGRATIRRCNLDGDRQADLSVHGGRDRAIYVYPSEHYSYWEERLSVSELSWAHFGENLTTEGLLEDEVRIGDRFQVGSAEVQVSQPRIPCFKLSIRTGQPDIVDQVLASGRTGFYLRVLEEGDVAAGDAIVRRQRASDSLTVSDLLSLYLGQENDPRLLRRASLLEALEEGWRNRMSKRLSQLEGKHTASG